jgi:hypothetical protein
MHGAWLVCTRCSPHLRCSALLPALLYLPVLPSNGHNCLISGRADPSGTSSSQVVAKVSSNVFQEFCGATDAECPTRCSGRVSMAQVTGAYEPLLSCLLMPGCCCCCLACR